MVKEVLYTTDVMPEGMYTGKPIWRVLIQEKGIEQVVEYAASRGIELSVHVEAIINNTKNGKRVKLSLSSMMPEDGKYDGHGVNTVLMQDPAYILQDIHCMYYYSEAMLKVAERKLGKIDTIIENKVDVYETLDWTW